MSSLSSQNPLTHRDYLTVMHVAGKEMVSHTIVEHATLISTPSVLLCHCFRSTTLTLTISTSHSHPLIITKSFLVTYARIWVQMSGCTDATCVNLMLTWSVPPRTQNLQFKLQFNQLIRCIISKRHHQVLLLTTGFHELNMHKHLFYKITH
ncbi:hypothetical protein Ddye_031939 [Dipteronia dyeriana]|uniref:Uncharacterized protein n=1 Tax=Dipteronia dyeriana TaxID=168575 RepID=A0AAD9TJC2_9ROSI|nr:hypothetical protein Ddye_031939 [Dipteronia dyeriana]